MPCRHWLITLTLTRRSICVNTCLGNTETLQRLQTDFSRDPCLSEALNPEPQSLNHKHSTRIFATFVTLTPVKGLSHQLQAVLLKNSIVLTVPVKDLLRKHISSISSGQNYNDCYNGRDYDDGHHDIIMMLVVVMMLMVLLAVVTIVLFVVVVGAGIFAMVVAVGGGAGAGVGAVVLLQQLLAVLALLATAVMVESVTVAAAEAVL